MMKDLLRPGGLDGVNRLKGYLPLGCNFGRAAFLDRVHVPPIWRMQSPRVFLKVMKPVLARLRYQGIQLVIYLDDMLVIVQMREELEGHL